MYAIMSAMDKIKRLLIISPDKNLLDILTFCFDGWGYEVSPVNAPSAEMSDIKRIGPDVIIVDVQAARKPQLHICQMLKDDSKTAFIPVITIINKRQLRQQLLEIRQGVDDYLIKPPDPLDLRIRIEMAIKRSQYSYHTNALTGLPGARVIEESVLDLIAKRVPFSFAYIDIDNFKAFNDVYGYFKGDQAIMQTAHLLYSSVRKLGNPQDCIGHIGGDDFVFISTIPRYKEICAHFISHFDRVMTFHYSSADRKRGFVVAKDRTHTLRQIPVMSLSVAVVNNPGGDTIKSMVEINDKLAEIKKFLKDIPGSKYMADRRTAQDGDAMEPQFVRQIAPEYRPLGQIMLEQGMITHEQLDEILKHNWRRGLLFGDVAREMGFVSREDVERVVTIQGCVGG